MRPVSGRIPVSQTIHCCTVWALVDPDYDSFAQCDECGQWWHRSTDGAYDYWSRRPTWWAHLVGWDRERSLRHAVARHERRVERHQRKGAS